MLSAYVHIPFCRQRCHYCDFITYAGKEKFIPSYLDALSKEIELVYTTLKNKQYIHSIYLGGGTPSLLTADEIDKLLKHFRQNAIITDDVEITLEVNPGTLTQEYFKEIIRAGVNRVSLGGQSLRDGDLAKLGRIHKVEDIFSAINAARQAGFKNISLDLIFGLPWQCLQDWIKVLDEVVDLGCTHLSLYDLSIEEGTLLYQWVEEGKYRKLDNDLSADMYLVAMEVLENAGYSQYEISNWSLGGLFESRHNKQYWYNLPYLGFGAGAHSYINGCRIANVTGISDYIELINADGMNQLKSSYSNACMTTTKIGEYEQMQDSMMLGLRMVKEGVDSSAFYARYAQTIENVFAKEIKVLIGKKLCEWIDILGILHFRLTKKGIPLANQAFKLFVGN